MKTLLLIAMTITTVAGSVVAEAQTPWRTPRGHFGLSSSRPTGLEDWGSRGTNVRLRVDSVDANGMVTASASGWVVGDVKAGGRGHFYVAVSSPPTMYRVTVDAPRLEAP